MIVNCSMTRWNGESEWQEREKVEIERQSQLGMIADRYIEREKAEIE